jgi:hypothetical protein
VSTSSGSIISSGVGSDGNLSLSSSLSLDSVVETSYLSLNPAYKNN